MMTNGLKVLSFFTMGVAGVVALVVWTDRNPSPAAWWVGTVATSIAAVCLIVLLIPGPKDQAPDYLIQLKNNGVWEKDGFCFVLGASVVDQTCFFDLYFQNSQDKKCTAKILLRPLQKLFGPQFVAIAFRIECGPAAFGIARIPAPIPIEAQGQRWSFDLGASVEYPDGRGECLRFKQGAWVSGDANNIDASGLMLTAVGALAGILVISSPARASFEIPIGVREVIPDEIEAEVTTLWQLGQPVESLSALLQRAASA